MDADLEFVFQQDRRKRGKETNYLVDLFGELHIEETSNTALANNLVTILEVADEFRDKDVAAPASIVLETNNTLSYLSSDKNASLQDTRLSVLSARRTHSDAIRDVLRDAKISQHDYQQLKDLTLKLNTQSYFKAHVPVLIEASEDVHQEVIDGDSRYIHSWKQGERVLLAFSPSAGLTKISCHRKWRRTPLR